MPVIREWFGRDISDTSEEAEAFRRGEQCPFIGAKCTKEQAGVVFGTCSIETRGAGVVPICPKRLYAENHRILRDVAGIAFGGTGKVVHPSQIRDAEGRDDVAVAFGTGFLGEIRIPAPRGAGNEKRYAVDWILAKLNPDLSVAEFTAIEVQSIDTTGSNQGAIHRMRQGQRGVVDTHAQPNWENVNKRILPQIIYKGNVLRQESLCKAGLFFVCPSAVYAHIRDRLSDDMVEYPRHPGAVTFMWYDAGLATDSEKSLTLAGHMTTTVEQLMLAFTGAKNMPPQGAYLTAIDGMVTRARGGLF